MTREEAIYIDPLTRQFVAEKKRSLSSPNYAQYGAMSVALRKGNKEVYCDFFF
jgi:hypothetical protein